jgi:hypothetical protein
LPCNLRDAAVDATELGISLPQRIDRVLGESERGNLRVWARVGDFDPLVNRPAHVATRSNATILAAACIVGLAVLTLHYPPQGWQRYGLRDGPRRAAATTPAPTAAKARVTVEPFVCRLTSTFKSYGAANAELISGPFVHSRLAQCDTLGRVAAWAEFL